MMRSKAMPRRSRTAKDFAHAHFNQALALLTVGDYRARFRAI